MEPITPLWEQMPLQPLRDTSEHTAKGGPIAASFTDIFQSAIDSVKETDKEKTQLEYLMATGQLDNPALLTIATTKAELAVDLLVQLRNKVMDAYSEVMRINV